MMGLAYIAAFIVYIVLCIAVVKFTTRWARNNNKNPKLWGVVAGLVMYNLVFWDFLPTLVLHKYYCAKESGFWVYKTAEQWRAENPDVVVGPVKAPNAELKFQAEGYAYYTLQDGTEGFYSPNSKTSSFKRPDHSTGYWLNDRMYYIRKPVSLPIVDVLITTYSLVDSITDDTLAKETTVSSGNMRPVELWIQFGTCNVSKPGLQKIMTSFEKLKGD